MTRFRAVALALVAASGVAATFACITGSPSANLSCTQSDPQSCACTADNKGGGDASCPSTTAASDTLCCAETYYPSIGSCSCARAPVGCAFDTYGCSCGLVELDAATIPSCDAPTQWASCCKSSAGCTCTLAPNAACNGTVVSSCSKADVDGGTCAAGTSDCTCSANNQFGTTSCGPPSVTCCLRSATYHPGFSSCVCGIGLQCGGGDQQVSSCSGAMVADAALQDFCSIRQLAGLRVQSCNPPPDGG